MNNVLDLKNENSNYKMSIINNLEQLVNNLFYYDNYFSIALSERVGNLEKYAEKLFENAVNFEIIDKNNKRHGMISFYANDLDSCIGFITLIVVDKESTNCGIGSKLITFAERYCKEKGMQKMKLEVLKDNENAIKFYNKHKYSTVAETNKSYYMMKDI